MSLTLSGLGNKGSFDYKLNGHSMVATRTLKKAEKPDREDRPKVSIIVVVTEDRGINSIFNTLDSFLPQEGDISFDFIVIDETSKERKKNFNECFPWVKLIQSERLMPVPYMRNIALQQARGEIVAFADDHIFFPSSYLKSLVEAFSKGYRVVGGPVGNANPESIAGWVQLFCEYHKWLPGMPDGVVEDLPGSNFAYHTDLLNKLGHFPEGQFGVESYLHKKAKEEGNKLFLCNGLVISHVNDEKITVFWKRRFRYGRLYASMRGFHIGKRLVYVLVSPLIAIIEYIRIFNHSKYDRTCLKKFFQCTPLLVPTLFIWMAGECTGYLFGVDNSGAKA